MRFAELRLLSEDVSFRQFRSVLEVDLDSLRAGLGRRLRERLVELWEYCRGSDNTAAFRELYDHLERATGDGSSYVPLARRFMSSAGITNEEWAVQLARYAPDKEGISTAIDQVLSVRSS